MFTYGHMDHKKWSHSLKCGFLLTSGSRASYTICLPQQDVHAVPVALLCHIPLSGHIPSGKANSRQWWDKFKAVCQQSHPNTVLPHLSGGLQAQEVPEKISNLAVGC